MAHIRLTKNEATFMLLTAMGFKAEYRSDADICTSNHTMELTDGKTGTKLEESPK
jgi:hypothetical protein